MLRVLRSTILPELPEVQTIVSDLNKKIVGYEVADFWSDWPKAIKNKNLRQFQKEIKNRKILAIRRIGKNIFIDLAGQKTLYIHLKMTGHLLVKNKSYKLKTKSYFNDKVNQYIHHIWKLEAKSQKLKATLEFSDVRKFAKIVFDDTEKIDALPEIKKLGVDAMSPKFTFAKFSEILSDHSNKTIGSVLMNQELIAGIGNIYRSELLHLAGILPQRKISSLHQKERQKIYRAISSILKKALKMRGTSDSDYRDTAGAPGNFQKILKVYRHTGKKCQKCGTIIKKSTLEQRSIFYCPKCQK